MIKHRRIRIVIIALALVFYPVVITATCDAIPSGTGGGGYGAPIPAGLYFTDSLWTCACWCGHTGCCIPLRTFPRVGVPVQFLFNAGICDCGSASGLLTQQGTGAPLTNELTLVQELTQEQVQAQLVKEIGLEWGDCKAFASGEWQKMNWGNPGSTMADLMKDAVPYKDYIAAGNTLKPGDMLFSPQEVGPTTSSGWHASLFYSPDGGSVVNGFGGQVIADPGLTAGPVKFSNFGYFAPNIEYVRPAPYKVQ